MSYPVISVEDCTGCGICVDACEHDVIEVVDDVATVVNSDNCIACDECKGECPSDAIVRIEE